MECQSETAEARDTGGDPNPAWPPDPAAPSTYPRRVLLAVTGLSPQVVTETLYALTCQNQPPFVPTEIRILSTSEGAARARLMLLDARDGQFHRFCTEYGLEASEIEFSVSHIHVVTDAAGHPLVDIDSAEANTAVADAVMATVRTLTADPRCAVHASIAGGRKTMGFYLGYALSLFGRPQDRLSHVLVSAPFESEPQFYYPPVEPRVLTVRGRPVYTADARVMLAEIPFVRLRHGLDPRLANGTASYSETVASAQAALGPPELILDLEGGRVRAAQHTFRLAPSKLALLAVFARRALAGKEPLPAPAKDAPDADWARRYLAQYRLARGEGSGLANAEHALRQGMDGGYFSSQLSNLRRTLRRELGAAAAPYLIDDGGSRPHRYRLALPPEQVRFTALDVAASAPRPQAARFQQPPRASRGSHPGEAET